MKIYICSIEGLADAASYDAASLKIAKCRRDKLSKIRGEADRRRSVCAGLLLNYAVAAYKAEAADAGTDETPELPEECHGREKHIQEFNVQELHLQKLLETAPQTYAYKQEGNSKPYIEDLPGFYFSLSHSGEYVLCVCDSNKVGADLQCMNRAVKDTLAKKVMTENEYGIYMELPQQDKEKEFYRVWAIKESFCKLTGKGLSQDFRKIEVEKINCYASLFKEEYWLAISR